MNSTLRPAGDLHRLPNPDGVAVDADAGHVLLDQHVLPTGTTASRARPTSTDRIAHLVPEGRRSTEALHLDRRPQALLLVGSRGDSVMLANLDCSGIENALWDSSADTRVPDPIKRNGVVRHHHRCERVHVLTGRKGPDTRGAGSDFSRRHRHPKGDGPSDRPTSRCGSITCPSRATRARGRRAPFLYWTDRGDPRAATR